MIEQNYSQTKKELVGISDWLKINIPPEPPTYNQGCS